MEKLEKLAQDIFGNPCNPNGTLFRSRPYPKGKITTITVENPCLDISIVIDEMAEKDDVTIPINANAYIVSDFNCSTQHTRKDPNGKEKAYSVYAVQFYHTLDNED